MQDSKPPRIEAAGFFDSVVGSQYGGTLIIQAISGEPYMERIRVYIDGINSGASLGRIGESLYILILQFPPSDPGMLFIELQTMDLAGNSAFGWPYLWVDE